MPIIPSIIADNPVLFVVLLMDVLAGIAILRNMLHPILGNFDIALIFQPMGETDAKGKKVEEPTMTIANRVEFNPMKEAFRVGKKNDAFTYKVDPTKVSFLQRTHRVYEYKKNFAYPMVMGYGKPARTTSSKGMDLFVAQKLWQQAVSATNKLNVTLPMFVMVLCVVAGLAGGFALFYALHTQLGFVPIGTYPVSSTTATTGTLGT